MLNGPVMTKDYMEECCKKMNEVWNFICKYLGDDGGFNCNLFLTINARFLNGLITAIHNSDHSEEEKKLFIQKIREEYIALIEEKLGEYN